MNTGPEAFPCHTCSTSFRSGDDHTEYAVNKSSLIPDSLSTIVALDAGRKGFLDVNNNLDRSGLVLLLRVKSKYVLMASLYIIYHSMGMP